MNIDDAADYLFDGKGVTPDVKAKVLAEKKAHDIVKELLEENIDPSCFSKSVYFLSCQHYQDVVEERAILKLCGYPVCDNPLQKVVNQQYKISGNRVYDLTQRKYFCSNPCYKASEHVKKQILTTPLWLRSHDSVPLELDTSGRGLKGEEVKLVPYADEVKRTKEVKENVSKASCLDSVAEFKSNDTAETPVRITSASTALPQQQNTSGCMPSKTSNSGESLTVDSLDASSKAHPKNRQSDFEKVLQTLDEWITPETLQLLGYTRPSSIDSDTRTAEEPRRKEKMKLLEERINELVLGEGPAVPAKERNLPVKETMQVYQERVDCFYKGQMDYRKQVQIKERDTEKKNDNSQNHLLPYVDSQHQTVIRRKILHQKLSKVCNDLLPSLPTSVSSHELKELVATFKLSNTNVVLKTQEYPLMAIMLILILSDSNLDIRRSVEQSKATIVPILTVYKLNLGILSQSIAELLRKNAS